MRKLRGNGLGIRECILLGAAGVIVLIEMINAEVLGRTFHPEFLIFAGSLVTAAIAGWGEKRL